MPSSMQLPKGILQTFCSVKNAYDIIQTWTSSKSLTKLPFLMLLFFLSDRGKFNLKSLLIEIKKSERQIK